jgi:hypothetical protein
MTCFCSLQHLQTVNRLLYAGLTWTCIVLKYLQTGNSHMALLMAPSGSDIEERKCLPQTAHQIAFPYACCNIVYTPADRQQPHGAAHGAQQLRYRSTQAQQLTCFSLAATPADWQQPHGAPQGALQFLYITLN